MESEEQVSDSCQQVQFIDVLVGMDNMKVTWVFASLVQ